MYRALLRMLLLAAALLGLAACGGGGGSGGGGSPSYLGHLPSQHLAAASTTPSLR